MSFSRAAWADALHAVAEAWADPDHVPRMEAITNACETDGYLFTEAHATFAVNQQMDACVRASLQALTDTPAIAPAVHLRLAGTAPLYGFPLLTYLTLRGATVHLEATPTDRPLLHAFVEAVAEHVDARPVQWETASSTDRPLLVLGSDHAPEADWTYVERPALAVLDGNESADEREALAEDILVYDGRAPQQVGMIWAPEGLGPDAYLEALAHMRAAIPAHESIPGTLQMQQAFLKAQDAPHAYTEDLTFLLSKGTPEIQSGLHVRWVSYEALNDVQAWLKEHPDAIGTVLCRSGQIDRVRETVGADGSTQLLGTLHRADWWPPAVQTLPERFSA